MYNLTSKILSTAVIVASLLSLPNVFAQATLPWSQTAGIAVGIQHFITQESIVAPLPDNQCLWANVKIRSYFSADFDNDGNKDIWWIRYLRDNGVYQWDTNTNNVALIIPYAIPSVPYVWSKVYIHTPASAPNVLQIKANSQDYSPLTNKVWYRYSKVAPKNTNVRLVESEPVLLEAPANKNPLDAFFQVAYQIHYAWYRGVIPNQPNNYQTFPLPGSNLTNMGFFWWMTQSDSWFLKNPLSHNGGYWPELLLANNGVWPQLHANLGYINQNALYTTTDSIDWWNEIVHQNECYTTYISRCWDGFIDVSGQQPIDWATTQNYIITDAGVNEQCDPGADLNSSTDDALPSTAQAGSSCSATCTLIAPNAPILTIQKFQGTGSASINNQQTVWNPMVLQAGEDLWYRLRITNTWGPATNLELKDAFDSDLSCTYQGVSPTLATVPSLAIGASIANNFSLTFPNFPVGTYDVVIQCDRSVSSAGDTILNSFQLPTYNLPSNEVAALETVVINPNLTIDKQQRLLPSGTFTDAPLSYNSPADMEFRITISNDISAWVATNIRLDDQLPLGFVPNNTAIPCSSTPAVPAVTCTYGSFGWYQHIVSDSFDLQPGASRVFLISGTLTNTLTTENVAYLQSTVDFSIIDQDRVQQNPQTVVIPPVLTSTKLVRNFTKNIPNAAYAQADTQGTAVPVSGWDTVMYQFLINNTGGPVTQPVTITDTFPAGLLITDISIQWSSLPASSLPLTPSPVPFSFNISVPDSVVNNGNGQVTVVITATVPTNLPNGHYLNYHSLSYDGATSLDPGLDDRAYIVVGNNVPGTWNLVIEKTYQEGTASLDQITRNPWQSFVMQLVVTNTGTASVTGVYVSDVCDPRITCTSWSYSYSTSPNTSIVWTPPIVNNVLQTPNLAPANGLAPGQSVVIFVQWTVNTSAEWTIIPNTGYVYMLPWFTTPVDNDSAYIISPTLQRSFTFAKSASGAFSSGSVITYTLSFCNSWQTNITSYTLTDPLSFSFQYIPGSTLFNGTAISGNPTSSSNILTWWCGTTPNVLPSNCLLTPGQCATLNFNVRVVSVSPPSPVPSVANILNTPAVAQ